MADDPENVADTSGGGDIVVTDKELFDHAISDAKSPDQVRGQPAAPAPAEAPQPQPASESQETAAQRQRDEQGRFVPKQAQQPAQQDAQKPAPQQPPVGAEGRRVPEDHRVPLRELLDERERRQRIEAEAAQMRQAWAQLQQQAAAMQQQQAPQTIFDNPDDYLAQRVMNPLREEGQRYMLQIKDGLSREMANFQYREKAGQMIDQALADLKTIRHSPQGDVLYWQIMNSGHPYGALLRWHSQARAQQAIGSDPNAWLQKKYQEWEDNPQVQARILQKWRQQQQQTNRPPNVSLPPSLSSVPSSSGRIDEQGDLSNESLYRFATK